MMHKFSISPKQVFSTLKQYRSLIKTSVERDIIARYRGSTLGIFWSLINPLALLFIYTFVFAEILQLKWANSGNSKAEFGLILFLGLIIYNFFAETIINAQRSIISNKNFVKKVIYPIEILPLVNVLSGLFHLIVNMLVWAFAHSIILGFTAKTTILLPLVLLPFFFITLGLSWAISALAVYLRDLSQFIGLLVTAMLFMSPVFYSIDAFPEKFKLLLFMNPITFAVEQSRNLLMWGVAPDLDALMLYWVISLGILWLGYVVFQKTRIGFADVL